MENTFKRLLFKTAFCCMACDGHIDQNEVDEIKKMDTNTTYFGDVDLSGELEILLNELVKNGKKVVNDLFEELKKVKLNPVQELLILEVALRIIHADEKTDENEIKFLNLLRGRLDVYDEIIIDRFGRDNLLFDKKYSDDVEISVNEYVKNIELPKFKEFADLTSSLDLNSK